MRKAIKLFFDDKPLKMGHAVRGVGYYTKNLLEQLVKSREITLVETEAQADLVHLPYFDLFFHTLKVGKKPTIVTIFDTIPLIYPEAYPPGLKGKLNLLRQKFELKKISAVITISETSKKDVVRFLGVPEGKIYPIHLAPNSRYRKLEGGRWKADIQKKYLLPKRFVLYVGDVNYNKNLLALTDACKGLDVGLVIVGRQAALDFGELETTHKENEPLVRLLGKYGKDSEIIRLGYVPQEDLIKIYNLATIYCQPSLYEGFGLPILEAFACGTPVVATKNQAHVEIADDACLFSGFSAVEFEGTIGRILKDEKMRARLIKRGCEVLNKYSWLATAKETIEIYMSWVKNEA